MESISVGMISVKSQNNINQYEPADLDSLDASDFRLPPSSIEK
jgi:hypothetical protein